MNFNQINNNQGKVITIIPSNAEQRFCLVTQRNVVMAAIEIAESQQHGVSRAAEELNPILTVIKAKLAAIEGQK